MLNSNLYLSFIFLCMSCFSLLADNPQTLNISDFLDEIPAETQSIYSLQNQVVRVRGFWYPLTANQGILASTPHLKSCCIKAPAKIYQQLIVKGDLASLSSQKAITLEGIFKIDPQYNSEKELIQLYVLINAKELQQPFSSRLLWILGLCAAAAVLVIILGLFLKQRY